MAVGMLAKSAVTNSATVREVVDMINNLHYKNSGVSPIINLVSTDGQMDEYLINISELRFLLWNI